MARNSLLKLIPRLAFIFAASASYAQTTRTFSCGGTYEDANGHPFPTMHAELTYNELENSQLFELRGEDSAFKIKGLLKVVDGKEFFLLELFSKNSGLEFFNNNSQLGQPGDREFNFVFLGAKNIGEVKTSQGAALNAVKSSFQCQTYRN